MTNRTRVMMLLLFLVSFAAGVGAAMVWRHGPPHPPEHGQGPGPGPGGGGPGGSRGGWLSSELSLSAEQQKEMSNIWDSVGRPNWQEDMEKRKAISRQRDDAVRLLVPAEKQAEFDAVMEASARQVSEVGDARRKAFEAAIAKTKALLSAEQWKKYEELMSRRGGRGGPGGGPGRDRDRGGERGDRPGPTTAPTTAPTSESETRTPR